MSQAACYLFMNTQAISEKSYLTISICSCSGKNNVIPLCSACSALMKKQYVAKVKTICRLFLYVLHSKENNVIPKKIGSALIRQENRLCIDSFTFV
jgi:hypothetical protein